LFYFRSAHDNVNSKWSGVPEPLTQETREALGKIWMGLGDYDFESGFPGFDNYAYHIRDSMKIYSFHITALRFHEIFPKMLTAIYEKHPTVTS